MSGNNANALRAMYNFATWLLSLGSQPLYIEEEEEEERLFGKMNVHYA